MSKILTVTIPSYNVENYLSETLPTLLAIELLQHIEILIVNDGSTDNTLKLAKELETQHPDVIRVIDKENGGHGSTINAGIKHATGKYFKVIDGDDWVDSNNFNQLVAYLLTANSDAVYSPYYEVYVDTGIEKIVTYPEVEHLETYSYEKFLELAKRLPDMHSVTILTAILKGNNIQIGEKMFYVDMEYIMFPAPFIQTVAYFGAPIYKYRLGTATQSVNRASFIKNRHMHQKVIFRLMAFFEKATLTGVVKEMVGKRIALMVDRHFKILLAMDEVQQSKAELLAFENQLKKESSIFWHQTEGWVVPLLRKTHYLLFAPISKVYRMRNGRKDRV